MTFEAGWGNAPAADWGQFKVTRAHADLNVALSVSYTVDWNLPGDATPGADYTLHHAGAGVIVIPVGAEHAFVDIEPFLDCLLEGTENVRMRLLPASIGGDQYAIPEGYDKATVEIQDRWETEPPAQID